MTVSSVRRPAARLALLALACLAASALAEEPSRLAFATRERKFEADVWDITDSVVAPDSFFGIRGPSGTTPVAPLSTLRVYSGALPADRASAVHLVEMPDGTLHGVIATRTETHYLQPGPAQAGARDSTLLSGGSLSSPQPVSITWRTRRHAHRRSVSGLNTANGTRCTLFLDADQYFFEQWAGACATNDTDVQCLARKSSRAAVQMLSVFAQTNAIFTAPSAFNGTLGFVVAGILIHTNDTFGVSAGTIDTPQSGSAILTAYQQYLAGSITVVNSTIQAASVRGDGLASASDVCLNYLFTHSYTGGSYPGGAEQAMASAGGGGLCASAADNSTGTFRAVNTGFVSTSGDYGVVQTWQQVVTLGHELGLSLGAGVDCSNMSRPQDCCPNDPYGGVYLMYPQLTRYGTLANAKRFSSCSLSAMPPVITAKGTCLAVPDPCSAGGDCCVNGSLAAAGTVCRTADASNPCSTTATCDGQNSFCPAAFRPDGSYCSSTPTDDTSYGLCYQGACSHPHEQFCQTTLGRHGCTIPGHECVVACQSDDGNLCAQFSVNCGILTDGVVLFWGNNGDCLYDDPGTPCALSGSAGACQGGDSCTSCLTCPFATTTTTPVPCTSWSSWSGCSAQCASTRTRSGPLCGTEVTRFKACCAVTLVLNVSFADFNETQFIQVIQDVTGYIVEVTSAAHSARRRRLLVGETVISIASINVTASALASAIAQNASEIAAALGYSVGLAPSTAGSSGSDTDTIIIAAVVGGAGGLLLLILIIILVRRRRATAGHSEPKSAKAPAPSRVKSKKPRLSELDDAHDAPPVIDDDPDGYAENGEPRKSRPSIILPELRFARALNSVRGDPSHGRLSLSVGDVIELTKCDPGAVWWEGIHKGQKGIFPRDDVGLFLRDSLSDGPAIKLPDALGAEETTADGEPSPKRDHPLASAPAPVPVPLTRERTLRQAPPPPTAAAVLAADAVAVAAAVTVRKDSEASSQESESDSGSECPPDENSLAMKPLLPGEVITQVRALHDFEARTMLELNLTEGALLEFEGTLSDYVRVSDGTSSGLVPNSYVRRVTPPPPPKPRSSPRPPSLAVSLKGSIHGGPGTPPPPYTPAPPMEQDESTSDKTVAVRPRPRPSVLFAAPPLDAETDDAKLRRARPSIMLVTSAAAYVDAHTDEDARLPRKSIILTSPMSSPLSEAHTEDTFVTDRRVSAFSEISEAASRRPSSRDPSVPDLEWDDTAVETPPDGPMETDIL